MLRRAGEPERAELSRQDAVGRRPAAVQHLGHGAFGDELPEPAGLRAAFPSAQVIRCWSNPSSQPAAAAAPKTPQVEVLCQWK